MENGFPQNVALVPKMLATTVTIDFSKIYHIINICVAIILILYSKHIVKHTFTHTHVWEEFYESKQY